MDGADEFVSSNGQFISFRLNYVLQLAQVQAGKPVMELGCGRGEATWQCARLKGYAVGLDFSSTAMQISSKLKSARARLWMNLTQASAYHLPFANDSFQTVLMLDVVEHLNELWATLVEVRRILCPGMGG